MKNNKSGISTDTISRNVSEKKIKFSNDKKNFLQNKSHGSIITQMVSFNTTLKD
jgi:hypothetical protein